MRRFGRDPASRAPLCLSQIYPNLAVRDRIHQWLAAGEKLEGGGTDGGGTDGGGADGGGAEGGDGGGDDGGERSSSGSSGGTP